MRSNENGETGRAADLPRSSSIKPKPRATPARSAGPVSSETARRQVSHTLPPDYNHAATRGWPSKAGKSPRLCNTSRPAPRPGASIPTKKGRPARRRTQPGCSPHIPPTPQIIHHESHFVKQVERILIPVPRPIDARPAWRDVPQLPPVMPLTFPVPAPDCRFPAVGRRLPFWQFPCPSPPVPPCLRACVPSCLRAFAVTVVIPHSALRTPHS